MDKFKVVVTDKQRRKFDFSFVPGIEQLDIVYYDALTKDTFAKACHDAFALIVDKTEVSAQEMRHLEHCRIILRMGIGYDNVDGEAARAKGIHLCNVPDYCVEEVANHALALFLAFNRRLLEYHHMMKEDTFIWQPFSPTKIPRLSELQAGIIGLGRIGTSLALRLQNLGLQVAFYDPYKDVGHERIYGFTRYDSLYEMLPKMDVISLHTPLTPQTERMVDKAFLNHLKSTAVLINTARGGIVQLDALYEALKEKRLLGACLDVFEKEPPEFDHPLLAAWCNEAPWVKDRLILTPHAAHYAEASSADLIHKAAMEIMRVANGRQPLSVVN